MRDGAPMDFCKIKGAAYAMLPLAFNYISSVPVILKMNCMMKMTIMRQ